MSPTAPAVTSASTHPAGAPLPTFATGLAEPGRTRLRQQSAICTWGSPITPTSPNSRPLGNDWPTSARSRPSSTVTTGSISRATSAPSTTRASAPTSCATTSAPTRSCRTSTRPRSPVQRPSNFGSLPNGDVLVADSSAVYLLDDTGNVVTHLSVRFASRLSGSALRPRHRPERHLVLGGRRLLRARLEGPDSRPTPRQPRRRAGVADDRHTSCLPLRPVRIRARSLRQPRRPPCPPPRRAWPSCPSRATSRRPPRSRRCSPTPTTDTPISGEQVTFTLNGTENVHRDDRQQRDRHLCHHPGRAVELLHVDGVVLR